MKFQNIFTAMLLLLSVQPFAANGVMKGDGSTAKPFQIEDYEDLKAIGKGAYLYSSNYVLTKDIDASASKNEMCNEEGCNGFIPIGKNKDAGDSIIFWGSIDGQNHTINNLTIWLPCERDVAFISYLGGSVSNLNFDYVNVTGRITESNYVATVAAKQMGSIKNVHVTNGFVQGQNYVGGIVGQSTKKYNENAVLEDVSFQGEIKGSQRVGGIVGETDMDVGRVSVDANIIVVKKDAGGIVGYLTGGVYQSRSSGTITPGASEVHDVGGIAGYSDGIINNCVSTMDLMHSGVYSLGEDIGGIVGEGGYVSGSYAMGIVEGKANVGGIAGSGFVETSFAMGEVHGGEYVGGLVGYGRANHSYSANVVRGKSLVGGLVGSAKDEIVSSYWNTEISGLDTSAGGTGLTTAKMMKFASFAGWDTLGYDEFVVDGTDTCEYYEHLHACYSPTGKFIRYWGIDEGKSFPYLVENPFSVKSLVPIAVPTSASKWQEQPKVASLFEVDGKLVGKWLGWAQPNKFGDPIERDSLYYGYRIGVVVGSDTVWGTSSYMAVPNKIEISTIAELQKIGNDIAYPLTASYELTKDIDASGFAFKPIGDSVHVFSGVLDGKNHTIKNLTINEPSRDFTGMFGYTDGAVVKNLKLKNIKVVGSWYVGALAGEMTTSIVENVVSVDGDITGVDYVGGLIGAAENDSICVVATTGSVKGTDFVGGLISYMDNISLQDAYSVNMIKGFENVGGAFGYHSGYRTIARIYSASVLKTGKNQYGVYYGEGFGYSPGYDDIDSSTVFFDSTVANNVRYGHGALPTEAMLKQATYKSFDFEKVWTIQEGKSYPYFKGMDAVYPGMLKDDGTLNVLAGAGTEMSPYQIYRYEDLKYIGKNEYGLDKCYKLMDNINAIESARENCNADSTVCKGFEPIGEFSGVFIGGNKTISNLMIYRPDEDSVGFFRALSKGAKIMGIVFDTAKVSDSYRKAGLMGPTVQGRNYVGALAGVDAGASIENVFVRADITGADNVGAIVGKKTSGSLVESASQGTVSGDGYVGGIVGALNNGNISDCYSVSFVSGTKNIGGLVGYSSNANVKNSFAAGYVAGTSKWGSLVGVDDKSTYTSVYYDSTLWAVSSTTVGELRSTSQMVKKENYQGWDFGATWKITADSTYPYLAWRNEKINVNQVLHFDTTMMRMAGDGTEANPFLVKTYSDLKSIGWGKFKLSAIYRLASDIDASASKTENLDHPIVLGFQPIGTSYHSDSERNLRTFIGRASGAFTGKIHGGGHVIKNLYMQSAQIGTYFIDDPMAFIVRIGEGGVIDSLSFKGMKVNNMTAGLAVRNFGTIDHVSIEGLFENGSTGMVWTNVGTIQHSEVKASLYGRNIAGIVTYNEGLITKSSVNVTIDGSDDYNNMSGGEGGIALSNRDNGVISECSAIVNITATETAGGIVANNSATIKNSTVSGVINGIPGKNGSVGGAVGYSYGGKIDRVYSSVDVVGDNRVGGLIGMNYGEVSNSISTGDVRVTGILEGISEGSYGKVLGFGGGFAGDNSGIIRRSYSTGTVYNGSSFLGRNYKTVEDCYSLGNVYVDVDGIEQKEFAKLGFTFMEYDTASVRGYAVGGVYREGVDPLCVALPKKGVSSDKFYFALNACSDSQMTGNGLALSEMHKQKSFAGFDFDSVWFIKEGVSYPLLRGLPNVPIAGNDGLVFDKKLVVKNVRQSLLDMAFVTDDSYTLVVKFDSASEKLLDSLEKAGEKAVGEFEIGYRIGMLFEKDTIWGSSSLAKVNVGGRTGVLVQVQRGKFNAKLQGTQVALRFEIPAAGAVKFSLVDMQGRAVRTFDLGHRAAGSYFETLGVAELGRGRYVGILQINGKAVEKTVLNKH